MEGKRERSELNNGSINRRYASHGLRVITNPVTGQTQLDRFLET
jgi:hypothetical protein